MKNRLKDGFFFALMGSLIMLITSLILGGEPYWHGIIGFMISGFVIGAVIRPFIQKKEKNRRKRI